MTSYTTTRNRKSRGRPANAIDRFAWKLDIAAPNDQIFHVRREEMEAVVALQTHCATLERKLAEKENTDA